MIFSDSRSDTRQVFFDVWRKLQEDKQLTALEATIADVIELHPEYHGLLADPNRHLDADYTPDQGMTNPFLHMGMHIAIREQLATQRPAGINALHERLLASCADAHTAEHIMLECLGETLWEAQSRGTLPDESAYLQRIKKRTG